MTPFTGEIPEIVLRHMIRIGSNGPCEKSKRVSAIIYNQSNFVVAVNQPPYPFECTGDDICKQNCNKICVHAEEAAIMDALHTWSYDRSMILKSSCIHLKIVEGKPVPSGEPSCVYCSRKLLYAGVKYMWLWQENGWKRWTTEDFHRETIINCGLNKGSLL